MVVNARVLLEVHRRKQTVAIPDDLIPATGVEHNRHSLNNYVMPVGA